MQFYKLADNSSSKVWEHFGVIIDEENNQVAGFAECKKCRKVLSYDSRKLGTSSLKKHSESSCSGNAAAAKPIDHFFTKTGELKAPKKQDKETVTKLAVKFVCSDIRSFETVCGEGFTGLAQGLIDVGVRAGHVDATQLLPDPTTVSRRVSKYAEDIRQSIIPELKQQLSEFNGAVTLDMSTDDYRKIGYICHTLHYINNNWELVGTSAFYIGVGQYATQNG